MTRSWKEKLKSWRENIHSVKLVENSESAERKAYYAALGRFLNWGHALGFSPYKFNKDGAEFEFNEKAVFRWSFYGMVLLTVIYEGFLIFRFMQTNQADTYNAITRAYYPVAYLLMNVTHWTTWREWGALDVFLNQCFAVTRRITVSARRHGYSSQSASLGNREGVSNTPKLFANMSVVVLPLAALLRALAVLRNPERPEWLSSALLDLRPSKGIPIWWRSLFAGVQAILTVWNIYWILLHGICILVYTASVEFISLTLRHSPKSGTVNNGFLGLTRRSHSYQLLRVLQSRVDSMHSLWVLATKLCAIMIVTVRLFLAIVFRNLGVGFTGMAALLLLLVCLRSFAQVAEGTKQTLETWSHFSTNDWFRRYRKSVRPIRVTLGGFYYADHGLMLTVIGIIFDKLTTLIMTYRESNNP